MACEGRGTGTVERQGRAEVPVCVRKGTVNALSHSCPALLALRQTRFNCNYFLSITFISTKKGTTVIQNKKKNTLS